MTDRELLELIATQVGTLTEQVGGFTKQVNGLTKDVSDLKKGQNKLEIAMENNISPKINALLDGYKQNTEKLEKIEEEVSKHEEIILRRVK